MRSPFGSLRSLAAVSAFVLLAAGSSPAGPASQAGLPASGPPGKGTGVEIAVQPTPQPWPPITLVFRDTFDSGSTYATYSGFGGAMVGIAGGRLWVQVPAGAPRDSAGLRMRLPRGGTGVRCSAFGGLQIPPLGNGSMRWKFFAFDAATGAERIFLELFLTEQVTAQATKQNQLTFVYQKNGQNVYADIKTGKSASDIKSMRWDTRNGGKQVQAEVTFNDGTKASSNWVDPEPGTISGFDITTDAAEFSADETGGTEVHSEGNPVEPAPIEKFDARALTALEPHWLIQTHDADVVLAATVERVGRLLPPLEDDPRPRVLVHYFLDEKLFGGPVAWRFAVAHAVGSPAALRRFQPGSRLLLFLHRAETGGRRSRLWDYGDPAGVIPYSKQNRKAVATRVAFIHGGNVP